MIYRLISEYVALRCRQLFIVACLLAAYGLGGIFLLPKLTETEWLSKTAERHQLRFSTERVNFNPFTFRLKMEGATLRSLSGHLTMSANSITLDIAVLPSLRHWRPVLAMNIKAPQIHFHLGDTWRPDKPPQASPVKTREAWPVVLGSIDINDGHVVLERKQPNGRIANRPLTDIALHLDRSVDSQEEPISINLSYRSPGEEQTKLAGSIFPAPLRFDLTIDAKEVDLASWLALVKPELSAVLPSGKISTRSHVTYPARTAIGVACAAEMVKLSSLEWRGHHHEYGNLKMRQLDLDDVRVADGTTQATVGKLLIAGFKAPEIQLDKISVDDIQADLGAQKFSFKSLQGGRLKSPRHRLDVMRFVLSSLRYESNHQRIELKSATLPAIAYQQHQAKGLSLSDLVYSYTDHLLNIKNIKLTQLQTIHPDGSDLQIDTLDLTDIRGDALKQLLMVGRINGGGIVSQKREVRLSPYTVDSVQYNKESQQIAINKVAISDIQYRDSLAHGVNVSGLAFAHADTTLSVVEWGMDSLRTSFGEVQQPSGTELQFSGEGKRGHVRSFTSAIIASRFGIVRNPKLTDMSFDLVVPHVQINQLSIPKADLTFGDVSDVSIEYAEVDLLPVIQFRSKRVKAGTLHHHNQSIASVDLQDLVANMGHQSLMVRQGELTQFTSPDFDLGKLAAERVSLDVQNRRFALDTLQLEDVEAHRQLAEDFLVDRHIASGLEVQPSFAREDPVAPGNSEASPYLPRWARMASFHAKEVRGDLLQRLFHAASIEASQASLDLRRKADRTLIIRGMARFLPSDPMKSNPLEFVTPPHQKWKIGIGDLQLHGTSIHLQDEKPNPPGRLRLEELNLAIRDLNTVTPGKLHFNLESRIGDHGHLKAVGYGYASPLVIKCQVGLDQLRLRALAPYFQPYSELDLENGRLNLWGDVNLHLSPDLKIHYQGAADIIDFSAIDKAANQPLMKWSSLKLDNLIINNRPFEVYAGRVTAEQPNAWIKINEQHEINLLRALGLPARQKKSLSTAGAASQGQAVTKRPFPLTLGLVKIGNAVVNLTDESRTPGYSTTIHKLSGTITGFDTRVQKQARIDLEGRINHNSPFTVEGSMNFLRYVEDSDIKLKLRKLSLASLSSYAARFSGYRVKRGRLDLDEHYRSNNGELGLISNATLSRIVLGDYVGKPGAETIIYDLALAALQDENGAIDIEFPIYGDLNDPKFSKTILLKEVLGKIYGLVANNILTHPINFIINLLDVNEYFTPHTYSVGFKPGLSSLDSSVNQALSRLKKDLEDHPLSTIEITGFADKVADRRAIAEQELLAQLQQRARDEVQRSASRRRAILTSDPNTEEYRRVFMDYYYETHPHTAASNATKGTLIRPTPSVFLTARSRVLEGWPVKETALQVLANERAEIIRAHLLDETDTSDDRIFVNDGKLRLKEGSSVYSDILLQEGK